MICTDTRPPIPYRQFKFWDGEADGRPFINFVVANSSKHEILRWVCLTMVRASNSIETVDPAKNYQVLETLKFETYPLAHINTVYIYIHMIFNQYWRFSSGSCSILRYFFDWVPWQLATSKTYLQFGDHSNIKGGIFHLRSFSS